MSAARDTMIQGSCIDVMAAMPAVSVDFILTDPPYVLDPFAGSGSTCVAARVTERRFIGIELGPVHHRKATASLAKRRAA